MIKKQIASGKKFTLQDMVKMQGDQTDIFLEGLKDALLRLMDK